MKKKWVFLLLSLGFASSAYGYKLRCNSSQSTCEVVTKRLTVGDHIGVFDQDGYIVAVGKVKKILHARRQVRIIRRFGKILGSHDALLIRDSEAQNPKKYFKFYLEAQQEGLGIQLGLLELGVGEGMTTYDVEGFMESAWRGSTAVVGRLFFMSGSGEASSTGDELKTETVDMTAFGLMGGVSQILFPKMSTSVRGEFALGIVNVSGSSSGGTDLQELVDGRIFPGVGMVTRLGASLLFRYEKSRPYFGAAVYRLQNSTDFGMHFGLLF